MSTDILFLDTPSSLAKYVEHGEGEVRYLSEAQCRTMFLDRRNDQFNPLRIINTPMAITKVFAGRNNDFHVFHIGFRSQAAPPFRTLTLPALGPLGIT